MLEQLLNSNNANADVTFLGEIPSSEFIDGVSLAALVGVTIGTPHNSDTPWLHVIIDNKELLISKSTIRHSISWNDLATANVKDGNRTLTINDKQYKIRLLKGVAGEGGGNVNDAYDPEIGYKSEWNRILYRLCIGPSEYSGEGIRYASLAQYTEAELNVVGQGGYNWCMEPNGGDALARGNIGIGGFFRGSRTVRDIARGWRPCLELIR